MQNFTPLTSLGGGIIIGLGAILLFWTNRKLAGVSGILGGLLSPTRGDILWRIMFFLGLIVGGFTQLILGTDAIAFELERSNSILILAGLLVGFGTRLGRGCTSGHGICGLGRLAPRSLLAVSTFLATGMLSATLVGTWLYGTV